MVFGKSVVGLGRWVKGVDEPSPEIPVDHSFAITVSASPNKYGNETGESGDAGDCWWHGKRTVGGRVSQGKSQPLVLMLCPMAAHRPHFLFWRMRKWHITHRPERG